MDTKQYIEHLLSLNSNEELDRELAELQLKLKILESNWEYLRTDPSRTADPPREQVVESSEAQPVTEDGNTTPSDSFTEEIVLTSSDKKGGLMRFSKIGQVGRALHCGHPIEVVYMDFSCACKVPLSENTRGRINSLKPLYNTFPKVFVDGARITAQLDPDLNRLCILKVTR